MKGPGQRLNASAEGPNNAPVYISYSEVRQHANRDSCWVVIEAQVYDVTSFLDKHPGGAETVLKYAGRDASYVTSFPNNSVSSLTQACSSLNRHVFASLHPPGTLGQLEPTAHIGPLDPATLPNKTSERSEEEKRIEVVRAALPPPEAALNIYDIEVGNAVSKPTICLFNLITCLAQELAKKCLSTTAWAYYRSAGDDEYSKRSPAG
jgi:L-lactate dehydrogenase (cytochrome)